MALRLTSCSPRRPGFVATVACASSRRLDASPGASEPHDLAVRFSIISPARIYARLTLPRPPHPAPRFVTCATPLYRAGTVRISELIWVGSEAKYFFKRGLTLLRKIRSEFGMAGKSVANATTLARLQIAQQTSFLVDTDERLAHFVRLPEQSSAARVLSHPPAPFPSWFSGTSTGSWRRIARRSRR